MSADSITLEGIARRYGKVAALSGLHLALQPGEIVAVTGPSGAGKTTLCRLISGIDLPDEGSVCFGEAVVNDWPAHARDVAYMFESFALYPHLPVFDNVAFPLRAPSRKGELSAELIRERVEEVLTLTEIAHLADRLPQALSGGQKQRVALCRCLVQRPRAYLLDEPISHLDAKLRNRLRGDIRRRLVASGRPAVWCTPDAMEAIAVADRVMVLIDGVVEQVGTPEEVYFQPANTRVARLIGDPTMNLLPGCVRRGGQGLLTFEAPGVALALPSHMEAALQGEPEIVLGLRPTKIGLEGKANGGGPNGSFDAEVYAWEPFGKYAILTAKVGDEIIKVKNTSMRRYSIGEPLRLSVDPEGLALFDKASGAAIATARS